MLRTARALALFMTTVMLAACGGGGGGGSGDSTPSGAFTMSATTANFTAIHGQPPSAPQVIHVHLLDNKSAVLGAAYVAPQTPPEWLKVAITGSAPDFDVNLSISDTGLAAGKVAAVLTLGTADAQGNVLQTQSVQVGLTITQGISADTTNISASLVLGQPTTSSTSTVNIVSDGQTQWAVGTSAAWISASSASGSGSGALTITVNDAGLAPGQYSGTVTITDQTYQADAVSIPVAMNVAAPAFGVSASPVTLGGADGLTPGPQTLQLSLGTGANSYPWTANVTTSSGGAWLKVGTTSGMVGGAGVSVSVDADYSSVAPGSYSGSIQLQATVQGVVISTSVPVVLNKEGHWLYVTAQGVAFSSFPSRSVLTRSLQVISTQNRTDVPWSAQADQSWLSVTSTGLTGGNLILTANPAGLAADHEYIGNVTITSSNTTILNNQTVRVGLWVGSADPADATIATHSLHLAANPVEPYVYADNGGSAVQVYNVYNGTSVGTLSTSLAQAADIIVAPDGKTLFVSDLTNLEVVAIDPSTGATIRHYPWGSGSSQGIAYARPGAQAVLLLGNGTVYDAASATKHTATYNAGWYGGALSFAVDGLSHSFYTQNLGLSPSTLTGFHIGFSALTPDGVTITMGPSNSGGSNGQDICVSGDGSKVYTANGAPYDFPAFSSGSLQPAQTLPGDAYPNNADCGWNGLFVGGADAYYSSSDVWVYRPDGTLVTSLKMHAAPNNNLVPRTLVLSGDNTRVIGSTDVPSLDFHSVPGP